MTTLRWLAAASLAFVLIPALSAEAHCPGNVASIRPRFIERSLIVLPVILNGHGPYDFVLDTADQITDVDPDLAAELHLPSQGTTHIIGVSTYTQASYAQLESLQAGAHTIENMLLLVSNLGQVHVTDPRIRGILGENFLGHFDLLIDYAHGIVCLDDTRQMREKVKGARIELVAPPPHPERNVQFTQPLIVPVRFSQHVGRPLHLQLDSACNVAILFDPADQLPHAKFTTSLRYSRGIGSEESAFSFLPSQDIQVGPSSLHQISFITPVPSRNNAPMKNPDADGLLPTALFRSVFISYADHFAILQP